MTLHDEPFRWESAVKTRKTLNNRVRAGVASMARPALQVALIVMGMAAGIPAHASQFGVRVVDDAGQPVPGASVCVGLPGNFKQFGALFTDAEGRAVVEVPNVPLVVTVSRTRFSGIRMNEPARGFNLVKEVILSEGIPGPRCRAGSTLADNESSVRIANVDVVEVADSTMLMPRVTGEPSHYRVSHSEGFYDAKWQRYDDSIALSPTLTGQAEVFLQMRRLEGTKRGWIEARSKVVTVQLPTVR